MGAVTSSMDVALRLESLCAAEGATVIAASQTHGRGRSDRTWQSPPNRGLYCSVLLRPEIPHHQFQSFSIAAGLAICEALDPDLSLGLQLKWPNDILFKDRKLAGILITSSLIGHIVSSAIVGIGLNLQADDSRPETAISLAEVDVAAQSLSDDPSKSILDALSRRYALICAGDASAIADWPARLAYRNQLVTLHDGQTTQTGNLEGLDPSGSLILRTPHGSRVITAGELTRGPRRA
jgi:BirA family biotin operon repressor/biotin-[acetyl-CoA-carboxylase] ligase